MGTGSFPVVKCGRGVLLTIHPLLVLGHTGPVTGMVPRQLACFDCWFESRRGHGCLSSGRDLYVGLITHPEETCRVWCVCDLGSSTVRKPKPTAGGRAIRKPVSFVRYVSVVPILLSVFEVVVPYRFPPQNSAHIYKLD